MQEKQRKADERAAKTCAEFGKGMDAVREANAYAEKMSKERLEVMRRTGTKIPVVHPSPHLSRTNEFTSPLRNPPSVGKFVTSSTPRKQYGWAQ